MFVDTTGHSLPCGKEYSKEMAKIKLIFLNKDDWGNWILSFRFAQRQNDNMDDFFWMPYRKGCALRGMSCLTRGAEKTGRVMVKKRDEA